MSERKVLDKGNSDVVYGGGELKGVRNSASDTMRGLLDDKSSIIND